MKFLILLQLFIYRIQINGFYVPLIIKHPVSLMKLECDDLMNEDIGPLQQLLIRFDCDSVNPEEISEFLFEMGTLSVSVEVETEKTDFLNDETKWSDLGKQKSWSTALLRSSFPSSFDSSMILSLLEATYPDISFQCDIVDLEPKDWVSEVQKNWKPQVIGDLTIRFPWHEEKTTSTSQELVLEGGAAFGTGDHPTTRLCCRWLDRLLISQKTSALSVLDYGCGSAILGLAALKYGAVEAVGVDIDKDSLISASNNCKMNNLSMQLYLASESEDCAGLEEQSVAMNALRGGGTRADLSAFRPLSDLDGQEFDIVVANILAPILIVLAPSLAARTKSGGKIGLSGILAQQSQIVIEKYKEFFNDVKVEETEDDWVVITGVKS